MNRLVVWTLAAVIAAVVAVFDLVSAWPLHAGASVVVGLALFGVAVALYGALLVTGVGERRQIVARSASSLEVVRRAAGSVRWSSVAAIALGVLLFANCSGSVTSAPPSNAGPMDDVSGFLKGSAEVFLPVVILIVIAAALATAAHMYAARDRLPSARKAAQATVWAVVAIAIVAVATVPIGFIFLASQCFFGTSTGACAAGAASFTNVFMAGTFALLLPYVLVIVRALKPVGPDSAET